jgi:hypothetical protein
MAMFYDIKPGEEVKIRLLKNEVEGIEPHYGVHYKSSPRKVSCPVCEAMARCKPIPQSSDEEIESRFEILDL